MLEPAFFKQKSLPNKHFFYSKSSPVDPIQYSNAYQINLFVIHTWKDRAYQSHRPNLCSSNL